jgi:hypothetical protein
MQDDPMSAAAFKIVHIAWAGPFHHIQVGAKKWHFEMHRYFGPTALDMHGDPLKRQPGERNPFWKAFELWDKQGRRVTDGDLCVWGHEG